MHEAEIIPAGARAGASHLSTRPGADEYAPYYGRYIERVPAGDVTQTLEAGLRDTLALLGSQAARSRADHRYAAGKWSVKEVLGHVIDAERVFAYRALAIARGETASLPNMEQDDYAAHANSNARTLADLVSEFKHVRASTLDLLRHLDERAWLRRGVVNAKPTSVRALAHIIAGHERHHLKVLRARYLSALGIV